MYPLRTIKTCRTFQRFCPSSGNLRANAFLFHIATMRKLPVDLYSYRSFQLWRQQWVTLWVLAGVFIHSLMERGTFFSIISENIAPNEKLKRMKFIYLLISYQNLIFIFNKIFKCTILWEITRGTNFTLFNFWINALFLKILGKLFRAP